MFVFRAKVVAFFQCGCIWVYVVEFWKSCEFGQKLFYWGISYCTRAKVEVYLQSGCNRARWLYSGKSAFIRGKVVLFGQNGVIPAKMVVFGQSG